MQDLINYLTLFVGFLYMVCFAWLLFWTPWIALAFRVRVLRQKSPKTWTSAIFGYPVFLLIIYMNKELYNITESDNLHSIIFIIVTFLLSMLLPSNILNMTKEIFKIDKY